MRPLNYPAGAVIESGSPALVETALVDGVPVKRNGVLVGRDVPRVIAQAEAARDRLLARSGISDPGRWRPPAYAAPR
jgi:5-methylthioadenosine/S-adenosylhomocysteine deaminase